MNLNGILGCAESRGDRHVRRRFVHRIRRMVPRPKRGRKRVHSCDRDADILDVYWFTVPFANQRQLAIHFAKHAHKFGLSTEREYEEMADAFMSQAINADLFECTSPHGSQRRYRLQGSTLYFGVAVQVTVLITFHPRDAHGVAMRGGPAGFVAHQCSLVR